MNDPTVKGLYAHDVEHGHDHLAVNIAPVPMTTQNYHTLLQHCTYHTWKELKVFCGVVEYASQHA